MCMREKIWGKKADKFFEESESIRNDSKSIKCSENSFMFSHATSSLEFLWNLSDARVSSYFTSTASPVGGSCWQPCRSARAPCSTSLLRNQNKTFDLRQREAEAKEIVIF